jgi:hypothetical protein
MSNETRSIQLRQKTIHEYVAGRTQGYKLVLEVESAEDMDPGIFVYQCSSNPVPGRPDIEEFSHIASPFDLANYPLDIPAAGGEYYRKTSAELVFRSLELLEQVRTKIETDVQELIRTLNQFDSLESESTTVELSADS